MARLIVVVMLACGCMSTSSARDRWPKNRARHDLRLETLEQLKIAQRIETLEKRVTELEGMLAAAKAPPPAPLEPLPPPAP